MDQSMKAFMLTLLLCFSCTKYAKVTKDDMDIRVEPIHMDIEHLNEIEWRVGKNKEHKITQSFTFLVDLPRVKQEDLKFLTQHRNIDSWIIRLIAVKGSKSQDLGSVYTLFEPKKFTRGAPTTGASSSVSIRIMYAAAYASERFRNDRCPKFNHNKKLTSLEVMGEDSEFSLKIDEVSPYPEKSNLVELAASSFNGGLTLEGDYYLEIAPYDSKRRKIHSNFKRIPRYVSVGKEEAIANESCIRFDSMPGYQ